MEVCLHAPHRIRIHARVRVDRPHLYVPWHWRLASLINENAQGLCANLFQPYLYIYPNELVQMLTCIVFHEERHGDPGFQAFQVEIFVFQFIEYYKLFKTLHCNILDICQ